jgi:hypothetical protein
MVERITSRRSTLRTLPALREEALPRPRAQRMCRGVHTESSADRSEMGQIDRSRRRRGCAGALRHKICTASLDNRPLIDGFVFRIDPPSFVLSHNIPMINTTSNWLCFGAFRAPPVPSLRIQWPSTTLLPLLTTRHYLLRPFPAGYCLTLTGNDRTGLDLDDRPLYYSVCHRIGRSLRTDQTFPPHTPPPGH